MEVWWDHPECNWFPCVVKAQCEDVDSTTASLCLYDDDTHGRWHNLAAERWRRIAPTVERLSRLTMVAIRSSLFNGYGVQAPSSLRKDRLVGLLLATATTANNRRRHPSNTTTSNTTAADTSTTPTSTNTTPQHPNNRKRERAKYAFSHRQRMDRKRLKKLEHTPKRKHAVTAACQPRPKQRRTATQVSEG